MGEKETRKRRAGRPAEVGLFHSRGMRGDLLSLPLRLLHDISIFVNANGLRNFAVHPGGHQVCAFVFLFFPPLPLPLPLLLFLLRRRIVTRLRFASGN